MPDKIQSLKDIQNQFETLFVDMYGVIWDGTIFYPTVEPLFLALKQASKKIVILSNATTISPKLVLQYEKHGLIKGVHYDDFVTSGDVLKLKIAQGYFEQLAGKKEYTFYILGRDNPGLFELVSDHQTYDLNTADLFYVSSLEVDPQAALSLDRFLPDMKKALDRGLTLICANPDLFAFRGTFKYVRGGSVAAWYTAHGGKAVYIGKPYREIYQYALSVADTTALRTIMVGDTIRTDILGAQNSDIKSVLITKTGMTADEVAKGKTLDECYTLGGAVPDYLLPQIG